MRRAHNPPVVGSIPTRPTGFAGFASVVAGVSGFAVGGPGSLADPMASTWSTACAGRRRYWQLLVPLFAGGALSSDFGVNRVGVVALALRVRANATVNNSVRCSRRLVSLYAAFAGCPDARAPSRKEATQAIGEGPACGEAALFTELPAAAPRLPVDVDHGALLGDLQRRSLAS